MIRVAQCRDDGIATGIRLIGFLRKYKTEAAINLCPGEMEEAFAASGMADDRLAMLCAGHAERESC